MRGDHGQPYKPRTAVHGGKVGRGLSQVFQLAGVSGLAPEGVMFPLVDGGFSARSV